MTNWKYTDADNRVVARTLENGGMASCLADTQEIQDWVAEGNTIEPYVAPQIVPAKIDARQIRQALTRVGLRGAVEEAVAAGDQDLKDWYEQSLNFEIDNPHVVAMATLLKVSDADLVALWTLGASL